MFDAINDILYKTHDEITNDLLSDFDYYMTVTWLSFYDPFYAEYGNELMNGTLLNAPKVTQYKYLKSMIPNLPRKKIQYIKKPQKDADPENFFVPAWKSSTEHRNNLKLLLELGDDED